MNRNWPTQQQDMETANEIIDKYLEIDDVESLDVVTFLIEDDTNNINIRPADWVLELADIFDGQYGKEMGQGITGMVVTKYLLQDEVIH